MLNWFHNYTWATTSETGSGQVLKLTGLPKLIQP